MYAYPEKTLQVNATRWLAVQRGYVELAQDAEATGERMDSIGLLDGTITAIEVKKAVSAGMVRFKDGQSGSIEAKIACTLHHLYAGTDEAQVNLIRQHWDQRAPLRIYVLAESFSSQALRELVTLLEERGRAWCFSGGILQWRDGKVVETYSVQAAMPPASWVGLQVPLLRGSQQRRAGLGMQELLQVAGERGVGEIFAAAVAAAKAQGFSIQRRVSGVSFGWPGRSSLLTFFLPDAKATAINVGIAADILELDEARLPGEPAPRRGYMNTNRWLGTAHDVERLFALIGSALAR